MSLYSSKGFYLFHDTDGHLATLCEADMESPTWNNTREDDAFVWTEIGTDSRDTPTHCEVCQVLLYQPLTDDGLEYVASEIRETLCKLGGIADTDNPLFAWHKEYGADIERHYWPNGYDLSLFSHDEESEFYGHYLETLVWTGSISWRTNTDEFGGEEINSDGILDNYISVADLPDDITQAVIPDCRSFIAQYEEYAFYFQNADTLTIGQLAHDFSLTRNGHGAGFWDRGLGELGEWLTVMSRDFGEQSLYGDILCSDPENYLETVIPETLRVYLSS